ncbi:hypothetical protein CEXT_514911 [Caerostris extrusa]|uniref:Uncharacterized protein n=1 Tax=Caerostris extrusa TaxID=172846 RepID=A0AAV4SL76_CAEEX|nr:hypothetical protein CEXT_514911 [Caerostris extrusa]
MMNLLEKWKRGVPNCPCRTPTYLPSFRFNCRAADLHLNPHFGISLDVCLFLLLPLRKMSLTPPPHLSAGMLTCRCLSSELLFPDLINYLSRIERWHPVLEIDVQTTK